MNIDQATNIATNIAAGIAARIADAPLGPPGIALTVVIANLFVIASLLAVLWWMRRVPSRIRDRAAAGANVVTLSELAHRDPRAVDIAPLCVTGVLTADPGPELLSPVTRRRCAMFRVELDRVSELTGAPPRNGGPTPGGPVPFPGPENSTSGRKGRWVQRNSSSGSSWCRWAPPSLWPAGSCWMRTDGYGLPAEARH